MTTMYEQRFMLVAQGVDTNRYSTLKGDDSMLITGYWMTFRASTGEEFTVHRHTAEELPDVKLGATHWVRIVTGE